jgi:predicted enzyme related to lactoylglutathione lyase
MVEHGDYLIAGATDGAAIAGIGPPANAPSLPDWSIYFRTSDVDAAATKVRELGGSIQGEAMDFPASATSRSRWTRSMSASR